VTPIRTVRFGVAAALLTGVTGFAAFPAQASAAPAASQPPAAAATGTTVAGTTVGGTTVAGTTVAGTTVGGTTVGGTTSLTLRNGTRVVMNAPWAAAAGRTDATGRARIFTNAGLEGVFCFYGVAQSLARGQRRPRQRPRSTR
jgi:hypothetical protein